MRAILSRPHFENPHVIGGRAGRRRGLLRWPPAKTPPAKRRSPSRGGELPGERPVIHPSLAWLVCSVVTLNEGDGDPVVWLSEHAGAIRTIDPSDDDFSDLECIAEAIGDARIVWLGEPSHGDGAAFRAKDRLVRFLHRRHGFSTLLWESGFFDCAVMQEKLHEEGRTDAAASWGVFSIWGASHQTLPVFQYARSTYGSEDPLVMAGIDCQFSGRGSEGIKDFVLRFFDEAGKDTLSAELRAGLERANRHLFLSPFFPAESQLEKATAVLDEIAEGTKDPDSPLTKVHSERELSFLRQTLKCYAAQLTLRLRLRDEATRATASNLRERMMAENLLWHLEHAKPDARFIVWGAGIHGATNLAEVEPIDEATSFAGFEPAGNILRERFGDRYYSILFTAHHGHAAVVMAEAKPIPNAPEGSFETLCRSTGNAFTFVDLRAARREGGEWLREPRVARPLGYVDVTAAWPRICDALFVIEEMTPSTLPPDDAAGE